MRYVVRRELQKRFAMKIQNVFDVIYNILCKIYFFQLHTRRAKINKSNFIMKNFFKSRSSRADVLICAEV